MALKFSVNRNKTFSLLLGALLAVGVCGCAHRQANQAGKPSESAGASQTPLVSEIDPGATASAPETSPAAEATALATIGYKFPEQIGDWQLSAAPATNGLSTQAEYTNAKYGVSAATAMVLKHGKGNAKDSLGAAGVKNPTQKENMLCGEATDPYTEPMVACSGDLGEDLLTVTGYARNVSTAESVNEIVYTFSAQLHQQLLASAK